MTPLSVHFLPHLWGTWKAENISQDFVNLEAVGWVHFNVHSSWEKQSSTEWSQPDRLDNMSAWNMPPSNVLSLTYFTQSLEQPFEADVFITPMYSKKTAPPSLWAIFPVTQLVRRGVKPRLESEPWTHCQQGPWPDSGLVEGNATRRRDPGSRLIKIKWGPSYLRSNWNAQGVHGGDHRWWASPMRSGAHLSAAET